MIKYRTLAEMAQQKEKSKSEVTALSQSKLTVFHNLQLTFLAANAKLKKGLSPLPFAGYLCRVYLPKYTLEVPFSRRNIILPHRTVHTVKPGYATGCRVARNSVEHVDRDRSAM